MANKSQIKDALLNTCVMQLRGTPKPGKPAEGEESERFPPNLTLSTCLNEPGFPGRAAALLNHEHFDTSDETVQAARVELAEQLWNLSERSER